MGIPMIAGVLKIADFEAKEMRDGLFGRKVNIFLTIKNISNSPVRVTAFSFIKKSAPDKFAQEIRCLDTNTSPFVEGMAAANASPSVTDLDFSTRDGNNWRASLPHHYIKNGETADVPLSDIKCPRGPTVLADFSASEYSLRHRRTEEGYTLEHFPVREYPLNGILYRNKGENWKIVRN